MDWRLKELMNEYWKIHIERTGEPVATRAQRAHSLPQRVIGLLGRATLAGGEGLILPACRSIHTWGMQFAIDAVFIDRRGGVVAVYESLPPGRMTPLVWRAQAVIELPAGTVGRLRLQVGDRLVLQPVHPHTKDVGVGGQGAKSP